MTPSPGTSICCRCGPKKQNNKQQTNPQTASAKGASQSLVGSLCASDGVSGHKEAAPLVGCNIWLCFRIHFPARVPSLCFSDNYYLAQTQHPWPTSWVGWVATQESPCGLFIWCSFIWRLPVAVGTELPPSILLAVVLERQACPCPCELCRSPDGPAEVKQTAGKC